VLKNCTNSSPRKQPRKQATHDVALRSSATDRISALKTAANVLLPIL
jgi:hypothetical protein